MQKQQVIQAIENTPKGANVIMEWVRPCKTRKGIACSVTKSVRMVGRCGIDYNKQEAVIQKRESGELPAAPQPIWHGKGEFEIFPFLIRHVDSGQNYLRLYKGTSASVKPEVHFFKDGVEVSKEEIAPLVLKSEIDSDHSGDDCLCVKIEDLTRLHTEAEWINLVVGQVGQEIIVTAEPVPAKVLATL